MKKLSIIFAFIACITLTSCVSSVAATVDDAPVSVEVIVSSGIPYYYRSYIEYYFYNGIYYYPYYYNNVLYLRPYARPFNHGYRPHFDRPRHGDIYRHHPHHTPAHRPGPAHRPNHGPNHRPNHDLNRGPNHRPSTHHNGNMSRPHAPHNNNHMHNSNRGHSGGHGGHFGGRR